MMAHQADDIATREAEAAFQRTFDNTGDVSAALEDHFRTFEETHRSCLREMHHNPKDGSRSVIEILGITSEPVVS